MCEINYHHTIMYFKCSGCGKTIASNEIEYKSEEVSKGVFNGSQHCPNCDTQIINAEYFWNKALTHKYTPPTIGDIYLIGTFTETK